MARAGVVATLLPGTTRLPADEPLRAGAPDGRARASPSRSERTAIRAPRTRSRCRPSHSSPPWAWVSRSEETLTAMTLNAAASVGEAKARGSLEPGKRADVVLLDAPSLEHLVYHWGVNLVSDVLAGGRARGRAGRPARLARVMTALVALSVSDFSLALASDAPAPGGGSAAAAAGASGAALLAMVVRLTLGKEKYRASWPELEPLADSPRRSPRPPPRARGRGHEGLRRRRGRAAASEGHAGGRGAKDTRGRRGERPRDHGADADRVLRARGAEDGASGAREGQPERGVRRVGRGAAPPRRGARRARERQDQPAGRVATRSFRGDSARMPTISREGPRRLSRRRTLSRRPAASPCEAAASRRGPRRAPRLVLSGRLSAAVLGFDRPADAFQPAPDGFHLVEETRRPPARRRASEVPVSAAAAASSIARRRS